MFYALLFSTKSSRFSRLLGESNSDTALRQMARSLSMCMCCSPILRAAPVRENEQFVKGPQ
ncbi:hypothetical protein pdam_00001863 [Pocillopora damicornis]|uniref:Uncharacterized protein n=1 Tax=Pocillopora damicornis TaxID=46731 RepID=A0A3M6TNV6_POCDA|nr:hypothetical protein pdam_00001863 [Pocillopora damicornis]